MATAYYPGCPTEPIPFYQCDECQDYESGSIRSVAFITKTYVPILLADPTNPALWEAGIESEDIYVIPRTIGSLDAPDPDTGDGYGDDEETNLGRVFAVNFRDPNYKKNCAFYNAINERNGFFHIAYRTETQTNISDKPVTPDVKAPIDEAKASIVTWQGRARWRSKKNPCPFDTPVGVFECFSLED